MKEKDWIILSAIGISGIGVIILIGFFVWLNNVGFSISGGEVKMDATGQVGDFIGGIVGSLWAFVGVILLYRTIIIQKDQSVAFEKEAELRQAENLILNQINMIQDRVSDLLKVNKNPDEIKAFGFIQIAINEIGLGGYDSIVQERFNSKNQDHRKLHKHFHDFFFRHDFEFYWELVYPVLKLLSELVENENYPLKWKVNVKNLCYSQLRLGLFPSVIYRVRETFNRELEFIKLENGSVKDRDGKESQYGLKLRGANQKVKFFDEMIEFLNKTKSFGV